MTPRTRSKEYCRRHAFGTKYCVEGTGCVSCIDVVHGLCQPIMPRCLLLTDDAVRRLGSKLLSSLLYCPPRK